MSWLGKVGNAISNGVHNVGEGIEKARETVVKTATKGAEEVGEAVNHAAQFTAQTLNHQAQVLRVGLNRAVDTLGQIGSATLNTVKSLAAKAAVNAIGSAHPRDAQGMTFAETKGASSLAYNAKKDEVYRFPDGKEWKVADVQDDDKSGFRAIALQPTDPSDKRTIVAFAGTNPKSLKDWNTDIKQEFGLKTRQYDLALQFADKWKAQEGDNVHLTGHSLGGGLASYASVNTGLRATGLNAAPLSQNSLGGSAFDPKNINNPRISQYYVPSEILTDVDKLNPFSIRPGEQIPIRGKYPAIMPPGLSSLIFSVLNHTTGNCAPDVPLPVKV